MTAVPAPQLTFNDLHRLQPSLHAYLARFLPLFPRCDQGVSFLAYAEGLLSGERSKSVERMALRELEGHEPGALPAVLCGGQPWSDPPFLERHWQAVGAALGTREGVFLVDTIDMPKQGVHLVSGHGCGIRAGQNRTTTTAPRRLVVNSNVDPVRSHRVPGGPRTQRCQLALQGLHHYHQPRHDRMADQGGGSRQLGDAVGEGRDGHDRSSVAQTATVRQPRPVLPYQSITIELLEYRRPGASGRPGSSPSRTVAAPAPDRLPGPQDRLQGCLFGLQSGMDPVPQGPAQFLEEALHRVRFRGVGRLHHLRCREGLHVPALVAAGPVPDPAVDARLLGPGPPDAGHLLTLHVRLPRPPQLSHQRIEGHRHVGAGPADRRRPGHRHPARRPRLAHRVPQAQTHLIAPYDPLPRLQADRLQAFAEPPFFQVAWAWASACVCRGRDTLRRIPSRGSSVYMLPTV